MSPNTVKVPFKLVQPATDKSHTTLTQSAKEITWQPYWSVVISIPLPAW